MAFGWLAMLAFWGALAAGVVVLVRWLTASGGGSATASGPGATAGGESPPDILRRRLAAGEITEEAFEHRRRVRGGLSPPGRGTPLARTGVRRWMLAAWAAWAKPVGGGGAHDHSARRGRRAQPGGPCPELPRAGGVRRPQRGRRPHGPRPGPHGAARPGGARPDAAGAGRRGGVPPAAAVLRRLRGDAHRPRRGGRQARRAGRRGGRLPDQALQPAGAGGPGQGHAPPAPRRRGRGGRAGGPGGAALRRPGDRRGAPRGDGARARPWR